MNTRLKELRQALGLTQQEFADSIGLKRNTIATYEIGKSFPSERTISDICREFNVNEEWLRTGEGEPFRKLNRNQTITDFAGDLIKEDDSFKTRLIESLAKLSEDEWKVLEKIAVDLANKKDQG